MTGQRILIVAGVAVALALGGAAPVAAGHPIAEADLHIKKAGKAYKGDDVINLTGENQTVR